VGKQRRQQAAEMDGDGNGLSHGRLEQHKFFFLKTF
jgi:hypothetical protein